MIRTYSLAVPLLWAVLSTPLMYGQEYREFQFGMNLDALAKQTNVKGDQRTPSMPPGGGMY